MGFGLDELRFSTVYWYPTTDLLALDRRFGREFMERVHVHSALFEINKIASLRPSQIDLGPFAHHHTVALEALWRTIFQRVWAQWRFENDLPDATPPAWQSRPVGEGVPAARRDRVDPDLLFFCGGGKDSLVSMRLLEHARIPFASFAYAATTYGRIPPQERLLDRLLDHGIPTVRRRQVVLDDFVDSPVLALYGEAAGVHTLVAAETPSSIFGALPVLLDRGHPFAVLGHEASANRGNLIWSKTGEEVNHQWGKSVEAERLIDTYIRQELVEDIGVFSLLMPIHDVLIFSLLRGEQEALLATHSCNEAKPWCRRCAKCAYVWLGYRAHLDAALVERIFPVDLVEMEENLVHFTDMLGLGAHTPFECIGHIEESRLALALVGARGLLGPRGRRLLAQLQPVDLGSTLDRYLAVDLAGARLPPSVADAVAPQLHAAAGEARGRIGALLGPAG